MSKPFTYLIGWPELNKFYYGVRYVNGCYPSDLWTKYFTSGKKVWEFRKLHGDPILIQTRRIFETKAQAVEWEHKVLRRLKAAKRSDFLNATNGKAPSMQGRAHREESKLKSSISNIGVKRSAETVKNNSAAQLKRIAEGYADSEATRLKKSLSHVGVLKSPETCALIRSQKLGKFHWTNEMSGRYCVECPGEGWYRGKISHKLKKGAEAPF